MTLYIKNKIRAELAKKELPDLEFLFSEDVLKIAPELLDELLEEEKTRFAKKLETKDSDITFDLFEEESLLDYFTNYLYHLKGVFSTDTIRKIIEDFEPKLIDFGNEVSYNKRYFEMLKICKQNCKLDSEQEKIISDAIERFEVRGIGLNAKKQDELKDISQKLSKITTNFSNNVLDSENEFSYTITDFEIIKDLPKEVLERVKSPLSVSPQGREVEQFKYVFTANPSDYVNIVKYCSDSEVRKLFQQTRSSFASSGKFDNRDNVLNILKLKDQKAKLLGFKNYAELSLVFKMAETPEHVLDLLGKVSTRARVKAEEEIIFLKDYFKLESINEWDLAYYYRKLKEEKYKLDDKELKKYFEFETVLEGLFSTVEKLFGLELKEISNTLASPHSVSPKGREVTQSIFGDESDVRIYEVYREGKLIAYYMLDAFYREEKRSGAWADNLRSKFEDKLPFVINVCNFAKDSKATLLSLGEVQTIFHEFGHATHEMLGKSKYSDLTGFSVEWDFVEVPSQFLEHWADESESLITFAKHFETGEAIPQDFLDKLEQLDKIGNGNFVLKQNEYAFNDMLLYSESVSKDVEELDRKTLKIAKTHSLFDKNEDYKPYASFGHIFSGGYSAGYYSYMWAEIIELDILREFKKKGMFNKELAEKYTQKILEMGSMQKASEMFHNFMGREVDLEGFFEKKGI